MKVLIFCAHPDDEVIGMGGTIRKLANAGADIRLVHFSPGAEGYATLEEKDSICAIRAAEVKKVCALLGIGSYVNLGHLDWSIEVDNHSYRQVITQMREFQPDLVFTHRGADYHDHINVNQVVNEGCFHAPLACAIEQEPLCHDVPLYEFEVITLMPEPEIVMDITDVFETKLKAMEIYSSQTGVVGGSGQMLTGRALMRGQSIGVNYGEAFRRSRMRPRAMADINDFIK